MRASILSPPTGCFRSNETALHVVAGLSSPKRCDDFPGVIDHDQIVDDVAGAAIAGEAEGFVGNGAAGDQLMVRRKRPARSWIRVRAAQGFDALHYSTWNPQPDGHERALLRRSGKARRRSRLHSDGSNNAARKPQKSAIIFVALSPEGGYPECDNFQIYRADIDCD